MNAKNKDIVLFVLCDNTDLDHNTLLSLSLSKAGVSVIDTTLKAFNKTIYHLKDENYITEYLSVMDGKNKYTLTAKGMACVDSGGFSAEILQKELELELLQASIQTNKSVITTNRIQKISLYITGVAIVASTFFSALTYIYNTPLTLSRIDTVVIVSREYPPIADSLQLYRDTGKSDK